VIRENPVCGEIAPDLGLGYKTRSSMRLMLALLVWALRASAKSHSDLVLENLALRQQLASYARGRKRPQLKPHERKFWIALSALWARWRVPLLIVQPPTVIAWQWRGFQRSRRWRSGKPPMLSRRIAACAAEVFGPFLGPRTIAFPHVRRD
jgi:hypothetical protein